jgi:excisionase family DNA binding protein
VKDAEITDRLLTAEEAAHFMGLKVATIRKLCYQRRLPVVRPTGKRATRFRRKDLEALFRERTQPMLA